MSRLRKSLLGVVLSLGLMGMFGASGLAYLGQYPYDNTNPHTTGCDPTWATSSHGIAYGDQGYVELRYSSSCATAWAKFTCTSPIWPYGTCFDYMYKVVRTTDGATIIKSVSDGTPKGAYTYSNQVYDAGSITSQACLIAHNTRGLSYWACTVPF